MTCNEHHESISITKTSHARTFTNVKESRANSGSEDVEIVMSIVSSFSSSIEQVR